MTYTAQRFKSFEAYLAADPSDLPEGRCEYWIIDPQRSWVMVGTLVAGRYQFQTFMGDSAIVSPTFPELKLTAAIVLAG